VPAGERVAVRQTDTRGRGVFAAQYLQPGTVVAFFSNVIRLPYQQAVQRAHRLGLPDDSFIVVAYARPGALFDPTFQRAHDPPLWYFLNHACDTLANVDMEVRRAYDGTVTQVVWVTNVPVNADAELRYTYGGPVPPSWDR
jgi:hypothetical protein